MRLLRSFALFSVLSPLAGLGEFRRDDAFFEPINVCAIDGDGGAGGGGDGGGGASGGDGGTGGGAEPKYVTVEDMGKAISGALTAHSARLRKEALDPIQNTLKELSGTITKLAAPKEPDPAAPPAHKPPDPETLALKNQLEELKAANKNEREAREKAESKQRDDAAYSQLRTLVAKTARPELVDVVAKNLFYAEKVVTYDESGKPLFKARRAQYAGGPEEDVQLTLEDGVTQFFKSKEAAVFLPAPTQQRPGIQPPGVRPTGPQLRQPDANPQRPRSDKEKVERAMAKEQELLAAQQRQ